jgi:hypothetical protein
MDLIKQGLWDKIMSLVELKNYLSHRRIVNLYELSLHFQRDANVIRDMLEHWIRKGRLCKAPQSPGCGIKCVKCNPLMTEVYHWAEAQIIHRPETE